MNIEELFIITLFIDAKTQKIHQNDTNSYV